MQTRKIDFLNKSDKKITAPSIINVLGAVFLDIVIVLSIWFFLMFIGIGIWTANEFMIGAAIKPETQPGPLALMLISIPSLYLAISLLFIWRGRQLFLKQVSKTLKELIIFSVSTGFILFLFMTSATYILNLTGLAVKPTNQALLKHIGKQWPIAITLFAVVIAPIFEELFFRKQIFTRLVNAGYWASGYLLSSLLFALMHEPFPTQGLVQWSFMLGLYGFMGVVFAWVYEKTGRLWPAIVAHASNNIFAMLALAINSPMN